MPKTKVKARVSANAKVQRRKPVKAGSKNIGGNGGICVAKVLKIRRANKEKFQ